MCNIGIFFFNQESSKNYLKKCLYLERNMRKLRNEFLNDEEAYKKYQAVICLKIFRIWRVNGLRCFSERVSERAWILVWESEYEKRNNDILIYYLVDYIFIYRLWVKAKPIVRILFQEDFSFFFRFHLPR